MGFFSALGPVQPGRVWSSAGPAEGPCSGFQGTLLKQPDAGCDMLEASPERLTQRPIATGTGGVTEGRQGCRADTGRGWDGAAVGLRCRQGVDMATSESLPTVRNIQCARDYHPQDGGKRGSIR